MVRVLGIDPGPQRSAWVLWDSGGGVVECSAADNAEIRARLCCYDGLLAIERPQAYGGRCTPALLDTAIAAGGFAGAWRAPLVWLTYGEVSQHHTGRRGAKEADVRAALIERLGPVGTKSNPGPLYGLKVKDHHFSALAVALAAADRLTHRKKPFAMTNSPGMYR